MSLHVFLLGPDQWVDGHKPHPGDDIRRTLERLGLSDYTPNALRRLAAERIQSATADAVRGLIMDAEDQLPGEDPATFFERLEDQYAVDHYFLIVPRHAKMHGTVWEGSALRRDHKYGRHPHLVLFLESGTLRGSDAQGYTFTMKGQRTRYLESLLAMGGPVEFWSNATALLAGIERHARALAEP